MLGTDLTQLLQKLDHRNTHLIASHTKSSVISTASCEPSESIQTQHSNENVSHHPKTLACSQRFCFITNSLLVALKAQQLLVCESQGA